MLTGMSEKDHSTSYLKAAGELATAVDPTLLDDMARELAGVRERGGRLFILGVGGGAGHASHAVNDFRKLCGLESYAPTDNVSELTARTNDDGWETSFSNWLEVSRLS
jgi:D-sedoheptulose 7-phosphate isomerase